MATSKPYSVGYNGHARVCDCRNCCLLRAQAIAAETKRRMAEVPRAKKGATIFVRAHFRKGKHLTKMPNTRRWLWRYLK